LADRWNAALKGVFGCLKRPPALGITCHLRTDYDPALTRVTKALQGEGFGVLTEIDVQATLKKKLDVDFRPYKILGACNPPLAYRALQAAPEVGLLLPCNVTVTQVGENAVDISLVDPLMMMDFVRNPALAAVASEARDKLERVAAALKE
ncbi:MAG TPA: DUF302 domain-containing protein, partial [Phototrophicaceae bacterium]|nr:DUF302 domain-containing protein [Phototrophicaceae bacterium]